MAGHGHVTPNADGTRARCGGPKVCGECAIEFAQIALTPHECMCCPAEIRDLFACAHNAVVNHGTEREVKKFTDLREAVGRFQVLIDSHFAATKAREST